MGCRILEGREGRAVLYCSTTDWAFGPVFESVPAAESFLTWLKLAVHNERTIFGLPYDDPRSYKEESLTKLYAQWLGERRGKV